MSSIRLIASFHTLRQLLIRGDRYVSNALEVFEISKKLLQSAALLLVGALIGGLIGAEAQQSHQLRPSGICDWVDRFQVLNRPAEIRQSDVGWITEFSGIGSSTAANLRARLEDGPIRTAEDLLAVRGIGDKTALPIRILWGLEEEDCVIRIESP